MTSIRKPLTWGEPAMGAEADTPPRFHLPAGTVTFLMSDIEGSTRLWAEFPEKMELAVAATRRTLAAEHR